jgi:glucose-1-phosphate adenylyltransferase
VNSGIRKVNVLTQYKSFSLNRHIQREWNFLPCLLDEYIDIIPAQMRYGEFWYRGTADSIYQNIYTIERENPDLVLILAGDHIYKMDYSKMIEFHLQTGSEVTISVVEVPKGDSRHFGVVEVNHTHEVLAFHEKLDAPVTIPDKPDKIYASMGIYIFNKKALLEELIESADFETDHDFGKNIIPRLLGRRKIYAYPFADENRGAVPYWRDIGTLDAFYEANMDLVSVSPLFNLYDDRWPIHASQSRRPPVKTVFAEPGEKGRRGEAIDSIISNGCIISGGRVLCSVLSPDVRVNSFSRVENSVLMEGVEIGRHAKIKRAIIDKHVEILPGTVIGYDLEKDSKRFTVSDKGVVTIPKGRIIGPDVDRPRWKDSVIEHKEQLLSQHK